jgi:Na+-driven multidrug efflux pump
VIIRPFSSLARGTRVLVARRREDGDRNGAGIVLDNSLLLSLFPGLLIRFPGFCISHSILSFLFVFGAF